MGKQPKKERRKPTGSLRALKVSAQGVETESFKYKGSKPEIELSIMEEVLVVIEKTGLNPFELVSHPQQLAEGDFDFQLQTTMGTAFLDLTEVAPLKEEQGMLDPTTTRSSPYDRVSKTRTPKQLGDLVLQNIRAKSAKYGPGPIKFLLLYHTESRLSLDMHTIMYVQIQLAKEPVDFHKVVYFSGCSFHILFPNSGVEEWASIVEGSFNVSLTAIEAADITVIRTNPVPKPARE
jgi:hypothetical protein